MELYLNERKTAQEIINTGKCEDKIQNVLMLLARYYYHGLQIHRKKAITEYLDGWMQKHYKNYDINDWSNFFEVCVKNAKKYPLVQIDYVPITQAEMDIIEGLHGRKQKRLAFTILVLAKYGNMRNSKNSDWVATEEYQIFKRARVSGSLEDKNLLLHIFYKQKLIQFSHKVDNVNIKVMFINDDSPVILKVTDMRELGYQYTNYVSGGYSKCAECGKMFKVKMNNHKYCSGCAKYKPIEIKTIVCCDCGKEFQVKGINKNTKRCEPCQQKYRTVYWREYRRNQRKQQ